MSEEINNTEPETEPEEEFAAEFDEGFDLEATQDEEKSHATEQPANANEPASQPEPQQSPVPEITQQPEPAPEAHGKIASVPESIADEYEQLKKLNPNAAELALEDSAEGEAIRRRLENYGAEQAQDRAEMTLYKRHQAQATAQAYRRANAEIIKNGVPDFFAMMNDPKRSAEKDQYLGSLQNWIGSKSFKEGAELMQIYTNGRPEQVCELIKRFENEKSGRKADALAMQAVPSRGAPTAPTGIGDKNDFDAGWNLNE